MSKKEKTLKRQFKWWMILLLPLYSIACIIGMLIFILILTPLALIINAFCECFNLEQPSWIDNIIGNFNPL